MVKEDRPGLSLGSLDDPLGISNAVDIIGISGFSRTSMLMPDGEICFCGRGGLNMDSSDGPG